MALALLPLGLARARHGAGGFNSRRAAPGKGDRRLSLWPGRLARAYV